MTAPELQPPEPDLARAPWSARLAPGLDRELLVLLVVPLVGLLVSKYEGSTGWFNANLRGHLAASPQALDVLAHLWWFGTSVLLFGALPLAAAQAAGTPRLRGLGAGAGDWRFGLGASAALLAVMLPLAWAASRTGPFIHQYPMAAGAVHTWPLFLAYELAYVAYFAAWEFLFRGWMLFGLARRVGPGLAVVLQTLPFALMHVGKPELECYGSVVAGLALGILAWRTRSFWYGALVHAAVAVAMDLLCGRHHVGILNRF